MNYLMTLIGLLLILDALDCYRLFRLGAYKRGLVRGFTLGVALTALIAMALAAN